MCFCLCHEIKEKRTKLQTAETDLESKKQAFIVAVVDPEHKIEKGKNKRDHCRGNMPGETKAGTQYDEQPEASNTHRFQSGRVET